MIAVLGLSQLSARAFTLVRLIALILLAAFIHPVTSGPWCSEVPVNHEATATAVETPDDCCPNSGEGNSEDEGPCPCPYPCTTSCAGYLGRALPQVSSLQLSPPASELASAVAPSVIEPSAPDPHDILHVPKHAGC